MIIVVDKLTDIAPVLPLSALRQYEKIYIVYKDKMVTITQIPADQHKEDGIDIYTTLYFMYVKSTYMYFAHNDTDVPFDEIKDYITFSTVDPTIYEQVMKLLQQPYTAPKDTGVTIKVPEEPAEEHAPKAKKTVKTKSKTKTKTTNKKMTAGAIDTSLWS